MRRVAIFAVLLPLSGCGYNTFLGDTQWIYWNPNRPIGDSENMRRVKGVEPSLEPLKPEAGNVWPGPIAPEPTLEDLEKTQSQDLLKLNGQPPNPSGTPMTTLPQVGPALPDHQQPRPAAPPGAAGSSLPPELQPMRTLPRASGSGSGDIVVPNGNGTSTVIRPDGSVVTIPTPK
jgi:hypothetical protein